jgi:integrase/recombinase XerD
LFGEQGGISGGNGRRKQLTSTKVPHVLEHGFLSVGEAAKRLGKSVTTITRWCETGKLLSIPKAYGQKTSYRIAPQAIEMLLLQEQVSKATVKQNKAVQPHSAYVNAWCQVMANGLMNGRAFSHHTVKAYRYRVEGFLARFPVVTVDALKMALAAIPVDSVAVREKLYKAVVCFSKFLIREDALDEGFPAQAKPLAPKYHKPPKRHTVQEDGLAALLSGCNTPIELAVVTLLAYTGLRASELCSLTLADIDMDAGCLIVRHGKGGKQRRVGLGKASLEAFALYLESSSPRSMASRLFMNAEGRPLNRYNLYQLLQRVGERVKVAVSPHALRRAFVTINANKGRPLQMLQMACGHSKITTTMGYCRTSEQEMIAAMKEWE